MNRPIARSKACRFAARVPLVASLLVVDSTCAVAAGPYAYLPSNDHATVSAVDLSNTAAIPATITVTGTENTTGFYGAALAAKGDMLYVPPRETHTVRNLSESEPAEYVVARDSPTEDSVEVPWADRPAT